jgi:hypothetical protein
MNAALKCRLAVGSLLISSAKETASEVTVNAQRRSEGNSRQEIILGL